MSDLKTSTLINRQVPEFVRDEYPLFVSFLEAYYEFLDKQNEIYGEAKDLRYLSDVDFSLEQFESHFFNSFLPFVPNDVSINKETLIKNILPLYLSKGSEKSYKLLFRLLFNDDVVIENPGKNILIASDGRWSSDDVLRADTVVYSEYVSDGTKTIYFLPYIIEKDLFTVYIDDVVTTDYAYRKEYRKIIFNTAPAENSIIKIYYNNFDVSIIENRKITGLNSGAYSIIESTGVRNISGLSFYQLFLNKQKIFGNFINGELLNTDVIVDDLKIPLTLQAYSDISNITLTFGGSSYNVGDPVIIRGESTRRAIATVSSVTSGVIEEIQVVDGGTGFRQNDDVVANGYSNAFFTGIVSSVDTTGQFTPNTLSYNIDVISNFLSVNISDANYGFPAAGSENVNTIIAQALTSNVINNLGIITSVNVTLSKISTSLSPEFIALTTKVTEGVRVGDLGVIGRINVVSGGSNYQVGEWLTFTNTPDSFSGQGANAFVSSVNVNGAITKVSVVSGGIGYEKDFLPIISVSSANGTNASFNVSVMGEATFSSVVSDIPAGRILSLRILEPGSGYRINPGVDLTLSGDGTATAFANVSNSINSLPGRWKAPNGIISSDEIKLQGRDYYINYAYVINSQTEFNRYKALLKNLIHPAGLINYAKYRINELTESSIAAQVDDSLTLTVAGTVNVNSSVYIIGTNTYFEVANSLGIISTGTQISINDETRTINRILSNTVMTIGRGPVTSVAIANSGNGYSNGFLIFSSTDTGNVAANVSFTVNSNGSIVRTNLVSGGSYADRPIAVPNNFGANNANVTIFGGGVFNSNANTKIIKIIS